MTEHELLCATKRYLMEHGWTQAFGGPGEPRCVLGALSSACADHSDLIAAAGGHLITALRKRSEISLPQWNDQPERTFADVIALVDDAILATAPKGPWSSLTSPDPVPA